MEKKGTKRLIIIIAAAGVMLAVLCVAGAVGVYKLIMGTDTQSDQYLEQILKNAEKGDDPAIASLYLSQGASREDIKSDIRELLEVWNRPQPYTYKKTGYQMNSTTVNGVKVKVYTSAYTITTESGETLTATMRREERADDSGITDFMIAPRESLKPVGKLGTIGRWTPIQWLLFAFSLAMIGGTAATAFDCYRRKPGYRWGWIALILLAYASAGFSLLREGGRMTLRFHFSATLLGLSSYVWYPNGTIIFRLYLPVGMIIYWILRKRLIPSD
ncbi:MAG: hypothetical protein LIP16_12310 [Clostridium sp.]|nr:hypothetical protein [Clostridium sp.]